MCQGRLWLSFSGIMLVLGAMASRAAQVTIIRRLGIATESHIILTFSFLRDGLIMLG